MAAQSQAYDYKPLGYVQLTSIDTAGLLTALITTAGATTPTPAETTSLKCLLQAEVQNVRIRDDGTNPTTGIGMILYAGAPPTPYEGDVSALRVISAVAGAKLNILFYND